MAPPTYEAPHPNQAMKGIQLDSVRVLEDFETWDSDRLADYFANSGLGHYREVIQYHRITGKIAPQLTNEDLKDMGIKIVGDRCRFRHQLKALGRKARAVQRNKLIWYGKEKLYFGGVEGCLATCGGICPDDPSTYRLTNNHLKIRLVEPTRVGPIRLCCCAKYSVNNIDLTQVDDVDMEGVPAPFLLQCLCCANGKEILDVSTNEGEFHLTVEAGEGESVSNMIMNQVEECQMMERD